MNRQGSTPASGANLRGDLLNFWLDPARPLPRVERRARMVRLDAGVEQPRKPLSPLERRARLADLGRRLSRTHFISRNRMHELRYASWQATLEFWQACRGFSDATISLLLLIALSPLLLVLFAVAKRGDAIRKEERVGRGGTRFYQYEMVFEDASAFLSRTMLRRLLLPWNVLRGEMSFVGPRAIAPGVGFSNCRTAARRWEVRPGILSLWAVRQRANIAYTDEESVDLEYVQRRTWRGDIGISVRALPGLLFKVDKKRFPKQIRFAGVRLDNLTMAAASDQIVNMARAGVPEQVCFVNADCVNIAYHDTEYKSTLAKARLVLADGIGVRLAGMIFDQNVQENVNGTDMLPFLCAALEKAGMGIYLLGGREGVPEAVGEWMKKRYPGLRVCGVQNGFFSEDERPGVVAQVANSGADVLLVGMGAPRQDKWIADNKHELGAKVMIGVGGLLDFYSGRIKRAPVWMRELGIEWVFRFIQEPRRMWRRYFVGNVVFLYRVIMDRIERGGTEQVENVNL